MKSTLLIILALLTSLKGYSVTEEIITCNTKGVIAANQLIINSALEVYQNGSRVILKNANVDLVFSDGVNEKHQLISGIGGIFNNINFQEDYFYSNDAQKYSFIQIENETIGLIQIAFKCATTYSINCEDRSPGIIDKAIVRLSLNGKAVNKILRCERHLIYF